MGIARTKAPAETPGPSPAPRLGQRATTIIDDGEYAGHQAVVDQIIAWPLFALAANRGAAFLAATTPDAELAALRAMIELYVARARPQWNLDDGRPVPVVVAEILVRVPVPLITTLYELWLDSFPRPPESPVADED